ncbi:hypothetical protein EVAR_42997_1 [Eumeta japonica]|uniref:Uncharacterized protein n=1 Tax=Eumeta variegata TaxID=151549 RepID=A0A4C1WDQ3_EUMVA|nr:hypothetical protein EVAR_42997_1 [Eumeta japonica]
MIDAESGRVCARVDDIFTVPRNGMVARNLVRFQIPNISDEGDRKAMKLVRYGISLESRGVLDSDSGSGSRAGSVDIKVRKALYTNGVIPLLSGRGARVAGGRLTTAGHVQREVTKRILH